MTNHNGDRVTKWTILIICLIAFSFTGLGQQFYTRVRAAGIVIGTQEKWLNWWNAGYLFILLALGDNRGKRQAWTVFAAACALMWTFSVVDVPLKVHFFLFSLLGFISIKIFRNPAFIIPAVWSACVINELIQYFIPNRYCQWQDSLINVVSGSFGIWIGWINKESPIIRTLKNWLRSRRKNVS